MDYQFDALDLADDSEAGRARNRAWLQAVMHGFHEGRIEDDYEEIWRAHLAADGVECRGAWLPEGAYGAGPAPVATTSWFDKTLNFGRELLPLRMITDVTTSPAHRRRGLVRRLMEDCLADAVAEGLPLAALTVSEATIYGRWGFGAATFGRRSSSTPAPGSGCATSPTPVASSWSTRAPRGRSIRERLDRFRLRSRGAVGTPQFYEPLLHRAPGTSARAARTSSCAARSTSTPTSTVDGMRAVQAGRPRRRGQPQDQGDAARSPTTPRPASRCGSSSAGSTWSRSVTTADFAAGRPAALGAARHQRAQGRQPLRVPAGCASSTSPARFAARPWTADGEVVLDVADAQGHVAGRWLVAPATAWPR